MMELVAWLLLLVLQAGLLGRSMYAVRIRRLCGDSGREAGRPSATNVRKSPCTHHAASHTQLLILSDLEADFINPFDVSTRLNSYVVRGVGCYTRRTLHQMNCRAFRKVAPLAAITFIGCRWWSCWCSCCLWWWW